MIRLASALCATLAVLVLAVLGAPGWFGKAAPPGPAGPQMAAAVPAKPAGPPPVPQPPPVAAVLRSGVLIVISKPAQEMFVFKDGTLWARSPVSTGKRGKTTPSGVFPILQKKVFHRSNIYSNAPMPFMQRLTWSGIAIHAGHLPGYPASHGCVRLPRAFAQSLYGLTKASSTTVVITNTLVRSDQQARVLALNTAAPKPPAVPGVAAPTPVPALAAAPRIEPQPLVPVSAPPPAGAGQTIQLSAAASAAEAESQWVQLVDRHPELAGYHKTVVPAVVKARQVYRLRATAPGAHAFCASIRQNGTACFNVS